jgi:hypothetical protein
VDPERTVTIDALPPYEAMVKNVMGHYFKEPKRIDQPVRLRICGNVALAGPLDCPEGCV